MTNSLLSVFQKIILAIFVCMYLFVLFWSSDSYALDLEQQFRPYSKAVFVVVIGCVLFFMKRKNWKSKLKWLVLMSILTVMMMTLSYHFNWLWDAASTILNSGAYDVDLADSLLNFYVLSTIGKLFFIISIGIFAFWSISKVIDGSSLSDK